MSPKVTASLVAVVGFIVVGFQSVFAVDPTQQAIVLQFGKPIRVIRDPGLNFMIPFWQNVVYLDRRLLQLDQPPKAVNAKDRKQLIVDAFARFQIVDPQKFYEFVNNEDNARQRLSIFLDSNMRSVLGDYNSTEIVSGQRAELMELIQQGVNREASAAGLGLIIKDVRIGRVDLPEDNSKAVYDRMRSDWQQEAAQYRAQGEENARRIRAEAERNQTVLLARAREEGEIKRGQGDALRNAIFACAFGADPDFFAFYRSMQAYDRAFQSQDTTLVLSPDSDFFRFFLNAERALSGVTEIQPEGDDGPRRQSKDPRCNVSGAYDLSDIDFLSVANQAATPQVPAAETPAPAPVAPPPNQ